MKFLLLLLSLFFSSVLQAQTLHLAIASNPARLNPLLATDSASSEITGFIFNGLVKYDKDNKNVIPDLAQSYHFKDSTTLVFKLKKNVYWHDGEKFDAQDVKFTYDLLHKKKIVSAYTGDFRFVKEVLIKDRYTIEVHYTKPYFKALEIWMMGIVPKHILEHETNIMSSSFNTHPIGTGAYKLKSLELSKGITLVSFDRYFEHKPKIQTIFFHIVADPTTRFLMLKSHQLDIGSIEPMAYERELKPDFFSHYNIFEKRSNSYTYLGFNLRKKIFQDKNVRQALSLAIDRKELAKILFFGHAQVCRGPFLPSSSAFNSSVAVPEYNIAKAKALLKKAGYTSEHPLSFEIVTSNASSIRPYAAQIIQYQLKKIGVDVHLRVMEWQAFLNMVVFPRKFDAVLLGWGLSVLPDPYSIWHSSNDKPGGFNFIGYHNDQVDRLIEYSQTLVDPQQRSQVYQKMFALIVADIPYLFLYIPNAITAYSKDIHNISPAVSGIWHNYIDWEK